MLDHYRLTDVRQPRQELKSRGMKSQPAPCAFFLHHVHVNLMARLSAQW